MGDLRRPAPIVASRLNRPRCSLAPVFGLDFGGRTLKLADCDWTTGNRWTYDLPANRTVDNLFDLTIRIPPRF